MAGETVITLVGNLTADPELRFTPSGASVANFTVASTPRTFDRQSNEWKDGDTLFLRCSIWREAAESVAATDPDQASSLLAQAARLVSEDHAADWLYNGASVLAVATDIGGMPSVSVNERLNLAELAKST